MALLDCIKNRFSAREFSPKDINDDILYEILEAGRLAPSAKNRQPWRFAVLKGREKSVVSQVYRNNIMHAQRKNDHLMEREFSSEGKTYEIIEQAPILILVFNAFPSESVFSRTDKPFDLANAQSIGAAIENMLLQATTLKVNSLWICDIVTASQDISRLFPDAGTLIAGIVLGYSPQSHRQTMRRTLDELLITIEEP